ncbi:hypothetical protein [Streptomyces sp. NPDC056165]
MVMAHPSLLRELVAGRLPLHRMRPGVSPIPVEEYRSSVEATGRAWTYE